MTQRHVLLFPDALGSELAQHILSFLPDSVEPVTGEVTDPDGLAARLNEFGGVRAAFLSWPYDRAAGRFTAPQNVPAVVEALAEHSGRIVLSSSHGLREGAPVTTYNAPHADFHRALEDRVRGSGVPWTILRPCMPAHMTLRWAEAIHSEGVVRGPYAKAARPLIDDRDVAEAVVRTLLDDGHDGASYFLTGSEPLTHEQRAETIGAVIGRRVRYEETPLEEARRMMLRTWPRELADAVLANMALQVIEPELPSSDFEHITGYPPRPFRAWVADHADAFR
ncbi:NAD(P)H-binding protein [Streptomyces lunalinharesii]|uniref:NAD(P)H-binding protein n=1 Tax=Streptomyces lunalinharesii TaxID=333384 RepID=A0ABN3SRH5_9ACTN